MNNTCLPDEIRAMKLEDLKDILSFPLYYGTPVVTDPKKVVRLYLGPTVLHKSERKTGMKMNLIERYLKERLFLEIALMDLEMMDDLGGFTNYELMRKLERRTYSELKSIINKIREL